jgi:sugar lactone lactonase YvrE
MMSAARVVAQSRFKHMCAQRNSEMKRLNESKWGTAGAGVGQSLKLSLACVAVALMLAACGGGGGSAPEADTSAPSGPKVAGTVAGLTASGLVLSNGTDTVTVPANAANFELPAGGTLAVAHQPLGFTQACEVGGTDSSPSVSCGAAAAKVSWFAGFTSGGFPQSNSAPILGPDGRLYFIGNTAVYSALPSGEGGYRLLAGSPYIQGATDGTGEAARFSYMSSMAMDADGNVYVLDQGNDAYSIRKITPAGVVSTMASGLGGANTELRQLALGPNQQLYVSSVQYVSGTYAVQRLNAQGQLDEVFNVATEIAAIAVGTDGVIYWADNTNYAVYKWAPGASSPTLLAGSGTGDSCYTYDMFTGERSTVCIDGAQQAARFGYMSGLVVDSQGVVYVKDENGTLLRRISAAGNVTTIVGKASAPVSGSADGTGAAATLDYGRGITLSADGNTLYADQGRSTNVRVVTQLSGSAASVSTVLTEANVLANQPNTGKQALFSNMSAVASDASGNLLVSDMVRADESTVIRKITPQGVVSTTGASVLSGYDVTSLKVGPDGLIYLAGYCSLERVGANGSANTVLVGNPGDPDACGPGTDGPAGQANVRSMRTIAPDGAGNVFIADGRQKLRKLASDGAIATLTLVDETGAPFPLTDWVAMVVDAKGQLYAANSQRVFKVVVQGTQGTLIRVAGSGATGVADGDALTAATFSSIYNLSLDAAGNLYVSDYNLLRQITPQGQVRTLAGNQTSPAMADGVGTGAGFGDILRRTGLTVTPGGELYVVDSGFLRKVEAVKAPSTPAKN